MGDRLRVPTGTSLNSHMFFDASNIVFKILDSIAGCSLGNRGFNRHVGNAHLHE